MQRFRALASARRSIPSLRRALSTPRASSAHDDELQSEVSLPSILIPEISLPLITFRFSLLIVGFAGAGRGQGGCPYRHPQPALCSQCSHQQHAVVLISCTSIISCRWLSWTVLPWVVEQESLFLGHFVLQLIRLYEFHIYTIFATPEVHIGFHPDAGASFYLSNLTGHLGTVLFMQLQSWFYHFYVNGLEVIDKCFGHETVEEILDALVSPLEAGGGNIVEATTNSSTELLLLSRASYTCSLFHTNDELRSFQSCLRWMCVDQSNARYALVSWSLFLLLGIFVLIISHFVPSCALTRRTYDVMVQLSYLCLFVFVYRFLFLDKMNLNSFLNLKLHVSVY
ncbi:hypothetical protein GW17_00003249 [Ensete ventricosum]|nr:hypothetical protein GW17_00003249 [Ensete ventricosum]